ncbi:glutamate receptor 2.8-like isoform X1 [Lycium barbarum]|uniref:glutamate receptor 2.8-like isoform X1 n=2 Tax=Lycium barbarum TaxID=112863 RepID=UPI00293E7493|nr:glutamate receptor 2.8-like isoform X1 [Lycium barbarum]XP_060206072.1 glutamate receptor 2.8-like isoform X1 [Lycium barbarum]
MKLILLFSVSLWMCSSFSNSLRTSFQNRTSYFQVGVILDLKSEVGSMGLSCMSMALSDFYSVHSNYSTRLSLHVRDSQGQVIEAAAAGLDLLKDVKVDAILGPETSAEANFLMDLGDRAQVPIISFSVTSPSLHTRTPYFVQAAQGDDTQVGAIAAIVKAFQWSQVVIIYEDSEYGSGIVPYLSNACQDVNAHISYRSVFPVSASDDFVLKELYKMMTLQTRVFVVHMSNNLGARLFLKANEIGMMEKGYAWIITSGLTDLVYLMDSDVAEAMQGVLGVKPLIPKSKQLNSFAHRLKKKSLDKNAGIARADLSIFGLSAYDTLWALAMAAERVGLKEPPKALENSSVNLSVSDLFNFKTSQVGPQLLKAMSETKFEGLTGKFHLVDGKMESSSYQIINVVGNGQKEVGVWIPSLGIRRELNMNITTHHTRSREYIGRIIWPGDSTVVPKGWEVPMSGKKLRIGVPVKAGFADFVRVTSDGQANARIISGFYIDVFKSVMEALPYAVPYELVPFENPDGSSAGTYNDLIYQVFLRNYDAAIGDITITANRSKYVDFTLPFAEGGVLSIVPIMYEDVNDIWAFLRPLKKELWLTSIAFFFLTGLTVWILEHRVSSAFRGPPSQHVGMICYFPFSTLVFAHREKIVNNLARLVVVVWMFVLLILSSTYTASLSSRLTVPKLQPSITDVRELIKNRDFVGCQEGSFIVDFLKKQGFEGSRIRTFTSPDDCDAALSRGSKNGGISAFYDVIPYSKLFLSKHCDKYMTVGPTHRTDGFAFAFPKGSPLVADVSRAVIELTENGKILAMEQNWLKNEPNCAGPDDSMNSITISFQSFKGLFAITGGVTAVCLLIFIASYLYKYRDFHRSISNSRITI